ncbi:MurR/RpiR family transcriptional regulator [Microvirga sp. W0021]|uniref:MurR/RpiR family transcriptional regulator n=1 Tax=Hohaiivirga grylli TaxID=3133970 RepID=A0ABV0BH55_9HYPH
MMSPAGESLLVKISDYRDKLRPSEGKLADLVMSEPASVIEMTMDEFAQKANVSAPTVARFCNAIGFSGFREFKIRLAQDRSYGLPYVHPDVSPTDSVHEIALKVFDRTLGELYAVRNAIEPDGLEKAAVILSKATRIEFYGSGNSGIVAQDIQHKFFRLGIPTVAYVDPHVFCMSALTLRSSDAVVLISNSGRNADIIEAAKDAASVGADVVAITRLGSPLAKLADAVISTRVSEDEDIYSPMNSRIAHLVLGDVMAVSVAQSKGEEVAERLEKAKDAVRRRRLIGG